MFDVDVCDRREFIRCLDSLNQASTTERTHQRKVPDEITQAGSNATGQADDYTADHDQYRQPTDRDAPARSRGHNATHNWAIRFKANSAAKRHLASTRPNQLVLLQGYNAQVLRVTEVNRQSARKANPTRYLEARGYTVKREGRHLSVQIGGEEAYRLTLMQDDYWLWCDRNGNIGGDNIALVRHIECLNYVEAVDRLSSVLMVHQQPSPSNPKRTRQTLRLPAENTQDRENGRAYLNEKRGITLDTIKYAEKAGMVRYADGCVLFVGYDNKSIPQSATRRAINPSSPRQKQDLRGSDKSYPPILPGDTANVWIVEGGVDALALHDMKKRYGHEPPTIIVSGGASVLSFFERDAVQKILEQATDITIAGDKEKNSDTQEKTDAGHAKQVQRVMAISSNGKVSYWTPKQNKDLAELNYHQLQIMGAAIR